MLSELTHAYALRFEIERILPEPRDVQKQPVADVEEAWLPQIGAGGEAPLGAPGLFIIAADDLNQRLSPRKVARRRTPREVNAPSVASRVEIVVGGLDSHVRRQAGPRDHALGAYDFDAFAAELDGRRGRIRMLVRPGREVDASEVLGDPHPPHPRRKNRAASERDRRLSNHLAV